MELQHSTILITSGIGLELVKRLTKHGANIIITGRDLEKLIAPQLNSKVHIFQSDVSKPENIRQLYNDVTRQFPELNIIINNAGEMRLLDLQDAGKTPET